MNKENCALKLVDEIILYYDARSKKHQKTIHCLKSAFGAHNKQKADKDYWLLGHDTKFTCNLEHVSEVFVDSIFRAIKGNKLLGELITLHKHTMGRQ